MAGFFWKSLTHPERALVSKVNGEKSLKMIQAEILGKKSNNEKGLNKKICI